MHGKYGDIIGFINTAPGDTRIKKFFREKLYAHLQNIIVNILLDDVMRSKDVGRAPLHFKDRTAADAIATIGNDSHNGMADTRQIERLCPEGSRHEADPARK
jgi:hypothetical protein